MTARKGRHDALHSRYGAPAAAARRAEGKDSGRIRLTDEAFAIIADLPKKAAWDQPKLPAAIATIAAWSENPALYTEPHDFETLVVDTLDWLEPLVWQHTPQTHLDYTTRIGILQDAMEGRMFQMTLDRLDDMAQPQLPNPAPEGQPP